MNAAREPVDDGERLRDFAAGRPGRHGFGHRDHVRAAWLQLRRDPLLVALARYVDDLKRFGAANGAPGRYHETLTLSLLLLVHERAHGPGAPATWAQFARANPDLLVDCRRVLARYYTSTALDAPEARRRLVLPELTTRDDRPPRSG